MDNATLHDLVAHIRQATQARFASVYFDSSHDTEDAEKVLELTWREQREELADQGADDATLDALERAVVSGPRSVGQRGRALIASDGQVLVDSELDVPPTRPVARWEVHRNGTSASTRVRSRGRTPRRWPTTSPYSPPACTPGSSCSPVR